MNNIAKITVNIIILTIAAVFFSSCVFKQNEHAVSEFSNQTDETFQHVTARHGDNAQRMLAYLKAFEGMGLTIFFDDMVTSNMFYEVYIDILPDMPFGLVNEAAFEVYFDFRAFIFNETGMRNGVGFAGFAGVSDNVVNKLIQNEMMDLYIQVATSKGREHFGEDALAVVNPFSNYNQETLRHLHLTYDEAIVAEFLRYLQIFEQMGITIEFGTRISDGILFPVYINILQGVPFGLLDADAFEVFFDFRAFVINCADIRTGVGFFDFYGVSPQIEYLITSHEDISEIFIEVAIRKLYEHFRHSN